MAMQELRVGICGCSSRYQGKLEGKHISLPVGDGNDDPDLFVLKEVLIPDTRDRRETVRSVRAHFFVDYHTIFRTNEADTELHRNQLIPNGKGRREKLYIAGWFVGWQVKVWRRKSGVRTSTILNGMERLMSCMTAEKRRVWLSRMTPEGWRLAA